MDARWSVLRRRLARVALALGLTMLLVGPGCIVVVPSKVCEPELRVPLVVPCTPIPEPKVVVPVCTPVPEPKIVVPICTPVAVCPTQAATVCPTQAMITCSPIVVTATPKVVPSAHPKVTSDP